MQRKQTDSASGSTLVVVAMLVAAVAMLSLSFLTVLQAAQKENQGSRESIAALYACEAGLTEAMDDVKRGSVVVAQGQTAPTWGTAAQPTNLGGQQYWVTATPLSDGRISLVGYGREDRAQMGVEMVVQQTPQGFFRWAAFGDEIVHMDANSRTDSYDSSVGDYDSQKVNGSGSNAYANTEGDVGSNANITMDSNIGVYGDANPGPSGSVSGDLGNILGNTTPMTTTIDLPAIVVPAATAPGGSNIVNASTTLSTGTYRYSTLQVNVGKTLTINGPATIVCDDFKLKSNSKVIVNPTNGPVEFFVVNDFVLNSNTQIYSTDYSPADVTFNLLSDNILDPGIDVSFDDDLVDFDSGSKMYGTIYAPSAEISIDSNFELFGALVARRIDLDSNCRIHYDELLATLSDGGEPVYEVLCWHLLKQP